MVKSVPDKPGPYFIDTSKPVGEQLIAMKQIDAVVSSSGSRKILQVITPAPIIPGKSTVELETKAATFRITTNSSPDQGACRPRNPP
jgi:hypothetical protein